MKTVFSYLFAFSVLLVPTGAASQEGSYNYFLSGNDLYRMCQSSRAEVQAFVMGFSDAMSLRDEVNTGQTLCAPDTVKSGQFVDVVCQYLTANPQNRHWRAAYQTLTSLQTAWPCQ